jgi:site-specific recombinase XerC
MSSEPLTKDEARRLIDAVGYGFAGIRDRAYMSILYRCGLRNNECRMLDIEDLRMDSEPWTVRVRHPKGVAKGALPRELGVDSVTRGHIEPWLQVRGLAAGPLFITRCGNRIDTSHFRRKIKVLAKSAGIIRRVHPHALRHTFARTLNDEGVSVRLIQLGLGHSNLNTTATYLQSLGDPEVIDLTSKRKW